MMVIPEYDEECDCEFCKEERRKRNIICHLIPERPENPPICPNCKVQAIRYAYNRWNYLKQGREEYRCPKCHRCVAVIPSEYYKQKQGTP